MAKNTGTRPVILSREDWAEIYYALDTKAKLIEDGNYGECDHVEAGTDCPERCDENWASDLRRIMETIGGDGQEVIERGVRAL